VTSMNLRTPWITGLIIAFWLVTLPSCEQYDQILVPDQKADFIGRWSEGPNFFELEPDGDVNLEIEGPTESFLVRKGSLRSFDGESICVGVGERQQGDCLTISETPYRSGGREVILVESVELARE
jgi:hypothetical protein